RFSIRSTAWNLQYHIIHTNIDVDDRASGMCDIRRQEFDKFGPAGAQHHFLDNKPDRDFPLDVYFTNQALSNLFKSLAAGSAVKFTDLHYPKSPEHKCNDQVLINAIQRAITELKAATQHCREKINSLEGEIDTYKSAVELDKKRVDEYDREIAAIDSDVLSEIDGEEGWTGRNV